MTYAQQWEDFPDYIIGITKEIWEGRGVDTLNHYYASDIPVRTPMGIQIGNQEVIASTWATLNEFPDRELLAEDVIWSNHPDHGHLSSHRIISTATHTNDGQFGPATGRKFVARVIAACAADGPTIYDEWLVRDYGGIVRQLGMEPRDFASHLISKEGGKSSAAPVFSPEIDVPHRYKGRGNDNHWGSRYADLLRQIMDRSETVFEDSYDRAAVGEYAGAMTRIGRIEMAKFWTGLRAAFPDAEFKIHHQIGMDADMLSPRASVRWSLDGAHSGPGMFGDPTGANVHVMGMSHAEFGPWGLRREFALFDEIAVWKQILMAS